MHEMQKTDSLSVHKSSSLSAATLLYKKTTGNLSVFKVRRNTNKTFETYTKFTRKILSTPSRGDLMRVRTLPWLQKENKVKMINGIKKLNKQPDKHKKTRNKEII